MGNTTVAVILAVVAGVVMLAALGGMVAGGVSTSEGPTLGVGAPGPGDDPPADGSYAVVDGAHREKAGFGIFGWEIVSATYRAMVRFVPPDGCDPPETGELIAEGPCAEVPAEGRISGGGVTIDGHWQVAVAVEVSKECHDALERGDHWPTDLEECAS